MTPVALARLHVREVPGWDARQPAHSKDKHCTVKKAGPAESHVESESFQMKTAETWQFF